MKRSFAFGVAVIVATVVSQAQATGIRLIIPELTNPTREGKLNKFLFGLGLDRDLNDRLSLGLDVLLDFSNSENSYQEFQVHLGNDIATYDLFTKVTAVTYRAVYAFSDNDETHLYLGSSIGYRRLNQTVSLGYLNGPGNYPGPFPQTAQGSVSVIPVGLRLGLAGGLDGGYSDLYLSTMYGIGSNKSAFSQPYFNGDALKPSSFIFSIGFAYGIGW